MYGVYVFTLLSLLHNFVPASCCKMDSESINRVSLRSGCSVDSQDDAIYRALQAYDAP